MPEFTVHAVRFATRAGRRGQHFLGYDDRVDEPHPTGYYVWLAVSDRHAVVVDAGLDPGRTGGLTGLEFACAPHEGIAALGVDPTDVGHLVLSHLHYDHTGSAARFPAARRVVQRSEADYWTGPVAARIRREHWLRSEEDLAHVLDPDGLDLVDGEHEVLPGLTLHHVGGHTAGMQVVRVRTAAGWVVLASDATHFYENIDDDRPAPLLHSVPEVYGAWDRMKELAAEPGLIVPGHDPGVMDRFERSSEHSVRIA